MQKKITQTLVESLIAPTQKDQFIVRDSILQGFGVRVTKNGAKSFIAEKRVRKASGPSRSCRTTIGRYPQISVVSARQEAMKFLSQMTFGHDINVERKKSLIVQEATEITLSEVLESYLLTRRNLKPLTIKDYKKAIKEAMPEWLERPLCELTKNDVANIHSQRGKKSKARADNAMRVLRALFNFAIEKYGECSDPPVFNLNPVTRLSNTKAWFNVSRRQTVIKPHQLSDWYKAVISLEDDNPNSHARVISDYLLFTLFNGLRKTESLTIKKSFVDLESRSFRLPDTKNNRAHTLPLTDFTYQLVKKRIEESNNEYLFPSLNNKSHLKDPRRQMIKVQEKSGVSFTLHDLRRTFATVAESVDIPYYALKYLLNHKTSSDVTAGYVVIDIERLREPMERVETELMREIKSEKK